MMCFTKNTRQKIDRWNVIISSFVCAFAILFEPASRRSEIAMYLVRQLTDFSLPEIGDQFGGRDHTTVMHACNKIENDLKEKGGLKALIDKLIHSIKN